jgi:hypothetical protein
MLCEMYWRGSSVFSLKGWYNIAQGNALGNDRQGTSQPERPGQNTYWVIVPAFQAGIGCRLVPRAMPWAMLSAALQAETKNPFLLPDLVHHRAFPLQIILLTVS